MYPNGTFDATKGKKCSGKTEQYVYENPCPKAAASSSASASASKSSGSEGPKETGEGSGSGSGNGGGDGNANAEGADKGKDDLTKTGDAVSTGFSLGNVLAVSMAVLLLQGLR